MHGVKFDQLKKRKQENNLFCDFKVIAVFYVNNNVRTFDAFVTLFNICTIYDRIILIYKCIPMQCYVSILLECQYLNLFFLFIVLLFTYMVLCQSFINLLSNKLKKIFLYLLYFQAFTRFLNTSKIVLGFHAIIVISVGPPFFKVSSIAATYFVILNLLTPSYHFFDALILIENTYHKLLFISYIYKCFCFSHHYYSCFPNIHLNL